MISPLDGKYMLPGLAVKLEGDGQWKIRTSAKIIHPGWDARKRTGNGKVADASEYRAATLPGWIQVDLELEPQPKLELPRSSARACNLPYLRIESSGTGIETADWCAEINPV